MLPRACGCVRRSSPVVSSYKRCWIVSITTFTSTGDQSGLCIIYHVQKGQKVSKQYQIKHRKKNRFLARTFWKFRSFCPKLLGDRGGSGLIVSVLLLYLQVVSCCVDASSTSGVYIPVSASAVYRRYQCFCRVYMRSIEKRWVQDCWFHVVSGYRGNSCG